MITSAGIGSGIDVESIITQLMSLERRPVQALEQRKSELSVQLTDIGKLRSDMDKLSDATSVLADPGKFGSWETTSNDEDILQVENVDGRFAENHSVEVLSLATAHRLISSPYDSLTADAGAGSHTFGSGTETFTVTLEPDSSSILDLRSAINDAPDNDSMLATVLNADDGTYLILTARNTGTENSLTAPASFSELTTAEDAELTIDGLTVTSSSNTLTETISGLTIDLKGTGSTDIESAQNKEEMVEMFTEFASSYNNLKDRMATLAEGSLQGDNINVQIDNTLRAVMFEPMEVAGDASYTIFDFGFSFDKEGILTFSESKMNEVATGNTQVLIDAFTETDTGFGDRMESALERFTGVDGFFSSRNNAIDARETALDRQIDRLEFRMIQTEARYRRQFGAMDSMIAELQSNGDYLLQALASNSNN